MPFHEEKSAILIDKMISRGYVDLLIASLLIQPDQLAGWERVFDGIELISSTKLIKGLILSFDLHSVVAKGKTFSFRKDGFSSFR